MRKSPGAWPKELVAIALSEFPFARSSEHGPAHWARVRHHGVALARHYGVNPLVPSLFALFHDCRRDNEFEDPEHGARAEDLVLDLARRGRLDCLSRSERQALGLACREHSDGLIDAPRLVQVCWDADRLDLGRVGIRPRPERLCTEAARASGRLEAAWRWSRGGALPALDAEPEEDAAWFPAEPAPVRRPRWG